MNMNHLIGLSPRLRDELSGLSLPYIRGKWHIVDPYKLTAADGGIPGSFSSIETAYDACTDEYGDGILVLSAGDSSAETTSYLDEPFTWAKDGITVVGVSSGTRVGGRARIANKTITTGSISTLAFVQGAGAVADTITDSANGFLTAGFEAGQVLRITTTGTGANGTGFVIASVTAGTITLTTTGTLVTETAANAGASTVNSYMVELMTISGANNSFYNIHFANYDSDAAAIGGVKVTGVRNNFVNCHFVGAGHATPGAVANHHALLLDAAEENTFERCTFGTDSVLWSAAGALVQVDGGCWRNKFYDCDFVCQSETAGQGAINSIDATSMSGVMVFARCRFVLWNTNGIGTSTSAFIGTKPTSGAILMDSCALVGWAAWDSVGGNDMVYIANSDATAAGAGGIATTP